MVSLCSKSYIIEDANGNQKVSFKGISKKNLKDPMQTFQEALHNKATIESNNVDGRWRFYQTLKYYIITLGVY